MFASWLSLSSSLSANHLKYKNTIGFIASWINPKCWDCKQLNSAKSPYSAFKFTLNLSRVDKLNGEYGPLALHYVVSDFGETKAVG